MTAEVLGPFWSGGNQGRFAGRYPLSVERHALAQVARLLPGVTSVTAHARYYTLHGLVAAEAEDLDLPTVEALDLLRRSEVVLAGISLAHMNDHPGVPAPHGADAVRPAMQSGELDVARLSAPGKYAKQQIGFWGPYFGSESTLGLVKWWNGAPRPGANLSVPDVRSGLGDILELARRDVIPVAELSAAQHLCMCQAANAPDGQLLQTLLLPSSEDVRAMHTEDRRSQTMRLLLRLLELGEEDHLPWRDVPAFLTFDPRVGSDSVVSGLDAYPAWVGVALRTRSVAAWRDLWAWLVKEIDGFMSIAALGDAFADTLPATSVRSFRDSLPPTCNEPAEGQRLLPAERDPSIIGADTPLRCLAVLFLGAARVAELPYKVAPYFEGPEPMQQLKPSWLEARVDDWLDRPLRDFAVFLTEQIVARSQRVALSKANFDRTTGIYRIPTRVFVRDGFIRRDSNEGGGGISMRWDRVMTVLSGLGLVAYDGSRWHVTEAGTDA